MRCDSTSRIGNSAVMWNVRCVLDFVVGGNVAVVHVSCSHSSLTSVESGLPAVNCSFVLSVTVSFDDVALQLGRLKDTIQLHAQIEVQFALNFRTKEKGPQAVTVLVHNWRLCRQRIDPAEHHLEQRMNSVMLAPGGWHQSHELTHLSVVGGG